jgi:hypothetical protein
MTVIARRWIVSTGELWLPDGSPTSKPDPETEDWVVLAEDYDALAEQLRGAVSLLAELGQCANTHDVFPVDTTVSVHVPLRLLRAARSATLGAVRTMSLIERCEVRADAHARAVDVQAATDRVMALMVREYGAARSEETREQAERLARTALGAQ